MGGRGGIRIAKSIERFRRDSISGLEVVVVYRANLANPDNSRWDADDRRVRRHVVDDDGIRADTRAIAHVNRADNLGPGADEDVATKYRTLATLRADCHLVLNLDVRPAADTPVDHDADCVDEYEAWAELSAAADDAIAKRRIDAIEQHLEWNKPPPPRRLHQPVPDHGRRSVG
jgi:hypothetical protein